jgi:lysophospholipase L1-like esterase
MTRRLSILANIILISFIGWYFLVHKDIRGYYQRHFNPQEDFLEDIYYKAAVDSYDALNASAKEARAVIIGDSIVAQFPVDELLPEAGALNRGIGFDTSRGVLLRLDRNVNNLKVAKFFLLVGHNDVKYRSVEEAARLISLIFSRVQAREKYFISVLPTADPGLDALIRELNQEVRFESGKGAFRYIDLYCKFLDANGVLDASLFYDGVHPNAAGYKVLADGLKGSLR